MSNSTPLYSVAEVVIEARSINLAHWRTNSIGSAMPHDHSSLGPSLRTWPSGGLQHLQDSQTVLACVH